MTLSERCKIHADKMDDEGWYVTANVLGEAGVEIERLTAMNLKQSTDVAEKFEQKDTEIERLVNKATEDVAEIAKLLKEVSEQRAEIKRQKAQLNEGHNGYAETFNQLGIVRTEIERLTEINKAQAEQLGLAYAEAKSLRDMLDKIAKHPDTPELLKAYARGDLNQKEPS